MDQPCLPRVGLHHAAKGLYLCHRDIPAAGRPWVSLAAGAAKRLGVCRSSRSVRGSSSAVFGAHAGRAWTTGPRQHAGAEAAPERFAQQLGCTGSTQGVQARLVAALPAQHFQRQQWYEPHKVSSSAAWPEAARCKAGTGVIVLDDRVQCIGCSALSQCPLGVFGPATPQLVCLAKCYWSSSQNHSGLKTGAGTAALLSSRPHRWHVLSELPIASRGCGHLRMSPTSGTIRPPSIMFLAA